MPIAALLTTMIATTAPTAKTVAQATPGGKRYCIKDRRFGSVGRAKVCRTREAWQARGFDPVVVLGRP